MDTLFLQRTERSPLLEFDFVGRRLRIEGESYPEDAAAFFGPVLKSLESYLSELSVQRPSSPLRLELRMAYFNSSSAKALMNIFQMLESAARQGVPVEVHWYYDPEDETMQEFGEDFSEDLEYARFNLHELEAQPS
ncbi:DUF1987 domain-containing protein [Imhoffiella purpurea]|uniref:Fe-S oxidoreductase n=1 Tax=Imhoffiella purpurea TaxID=1249627 RepID=W9VAW3_9GAMM|nr:DUF1987 domain-containing protein [Imhoffiella purpurea]EXJ14071.1 Fe-S oxidoreductase [Imhoffiella purpurea]